MIGQGHLGGVMTSIFASSSGGGETDLKSVKPKTTRLGGRKICPCGATCLSVE